MRAEAEIRRLENAARMAEIRIRTEELRARIEAGRRPVAVPAAIPVSIQVPAEPTKKAGAGWLALAAGLLMFL